MHIFPISHTTNKVDVLITALFIISSRKELGRIRSIRAKAKAIDKEAFQGFLQNGKWSDKEDNHCSSEGGDNQGDISKVTSLCKGTWTVKNEIANGRRHISFVKGLLLMMLILVVLFNFNNVSV
jgi:hypothetical protein